MPEQFPYPEKGWSTGRMRKKGKGYEPDFDWAFGQTAPPPGKMTAGQKIFERGRPDLPESASGRAAPTPTDEQMMKAISTPGYVAAAVMNRIATGPYAGRLTKQSLDGLIGDAQKQAKEGINIASMDDDEFHQMVIKRLNRVDNANSP